MFFAENPLGAAIAFIAFGVNFMGAAVLLLLNPASRSVRWYSLFAASLLLWLLLQGVMLTAGVRPLLRSIYLLNVHFMPALFLGAMLGQRFARPRLLPLLPPAAALLLLPAMPGLLSSPLELAWQALAWGGAAVLYVRHPWEPRRTRTARGLGLVLGGIVPVGVLGSILLKGGFVLYVLPVMTVLVQLLLFFGVVYYRYYDIEVRAARTGELAAAAAEQDRLAVLGELAATIAHEVRNPLTGIRSLTQMLAEGPVEDERRRRYTGVILDEITRLDRIVGSLTDLARRSAAGGAAPAVETPLGSLFEDLLMLVAPRAGRSDVSLEAAGNDVVVHAPRDAMAQALLNLLLNAIAHSPPGGTVRLEASREGRDVEIRVRDQGPGVPPEERERIFEPFHSERGTGLGLAVVRRLAGEHGWSVGVAESSGGGATFFLRLPGSV